VWRSTSGVDAQRRKSGAPGLRAVHEKDVVPDIAGKDRYLGVRDIRGIKSRAAADRHDRVRRTGDDRQVALQPSASIPSITALRSRARSRHKVKPAPI